MTYVAQFVHKYPEVRSDGGQSIDAIQKDYDMLLSWLNETTQRLSWPQNMTNDFSVSSPYENRSNQCIIVHALWFLIRTFQTPKMNSAAWL